MNKKLTLTLIILYTLPWGLQCIVNNFMSVYVASLPFSTEKTVGTVMAFCSVVTMLSQLVWARIAYRSKSKFNVLTASLLLLIVFSIPFLYMEMNVITLYISMFLFYFCFMVHQPLIDSIASENADKLTYSFGAVRSFASFGFALTGLFLGVIGFHNPKDIFYYIIIISGVSAIVSMASPKEPSSVKSQKKGFRLSELFNKRYVFFLLYTFLLYLTSAINMVFFPVYYKETLGGDLGILSILICIEAFLEWGIMIVLGKKISKSRPRMVFMIIALAAAFRCFAVCFTQNPYLILLTYLGAAVWFGVQWAAVAPYICRIVPEDGNVTAQSIWTLASSGVGVTVGSLLGGYIAEFTSVRALFFGATVLMLILAALSPVLFPSLKQDAPADTNA